MPQTFDEVIADVFTVKNDTIPQSAWPKLTCGVANEVTFVDSSLKLGDQREIFFQNAGQLRAAADLRFLTGAPATEKLRILPNGNVGIGTQTPAAKLQVTGGAIMPATGNSNQAGIQFPSGVTSDEAFIRYFTIVGETAKLQIGIGNDADDSIGLVQAGAERLTVINGRVGIGTTTPEGTLDVRGDIRAGSSDIYFTKTDHNHTGIGNTAGFAAIENSASHDGLMILGRAGTTRGRSVKLWDYLEVNGSLNVTGNVGIQTLTPMRALHVEGTEIHSGGFGGGLSFGNRETGSFVESGGNGERWVWYSSGGIARLWSGWDKMFITPGGSVGIGLAAPRTPLHVFGRIATGLDFSSAGAITFFPPDGFAWFHIDNGPAGGRPLGRLRISHGNSPGTFEIMSITQGANVGIGITSPQAKLHVSGPLIAAGAMFPSDARLKTNIEPMSDVLERLDQVRAVSFDWNEKYEVFGTPMGERQIGIIAQELEAVFPEMVMTVGDYDYKAIDYSKLTVLLLEALHELHAKVGQLERRVETERKGHA